MKNCIFFKLLAVLLCAASLLGVIGGAAGVLTLVEHDLYNRTIDEVMAQKVENHASSFATQAAYRYADQVLGGCPQELSRSLGSENILSRNYAFYGYSILDAEGNVLESLNPELQSHANTYSVPVSGQYMHLVSLKTDSQAQEEAAQKRLNSYKDVMTDIDGEAVPPEGISIHHVFFTGQDGSVLYEAFSDGTTGNSTYYYRDYLLENGTVDSFANSYNDHVSSRTGFLFYNTDGQLAYTSFLEEHENRFQTTVYGVWFHNGYQDFTFQTDDPEGIGILSNETGFLTFTSFAAAQQKGVEETVPVTTPETLPEETAAETQTGETIAETEAAETEATEYTEDTTPVETAYEEASEETAETYYEESSASDIPEEGGEEQWTEDSGEAQQVEESEAVEEAPQETVDAAPTEPPVENPDYSYLTELAQNRIYYEWLLSKGLIQQSDLPAYTISNEDLHNWLVYSGLISPEQSFSDLPPEEAAEDSLLINGKPLENYQVNHTDYYDRQTGEHTTAKYVYLPMPELTVEVYVSADAMKNAAVYSVLNLLRHYRDLLLPAIGICLLLFVLTAIYLCSAAGRRPRTVEVQASGINRLPLDLYLVLGGTVGCSLLALAFTGVPVLLNNDLTLGCALAAAAAFLCCLIFVGFCFAMAAQLKTGSGMWWRNALTVRFVFLFMRCADALCIWLRETALPVSAHFAKKLWQRIWKLLVRIYEAVEKGTARMSAKLNRYFSLMPLTWQWVVSGMLLLCLVLLACNTYSKLLTLLCLAAAFAIILYASHCFGILLESTRKMCNGNLDTKVDDKLMIGCFRDFSDDLSNLANVANVAAQKQLKSERMKTELITNVSHDIKTPLTSIINYVDLLQKPHSAEDEAQYLEVLDRQSQRLKKLVDDLMDMSKASTGNMAVEICTVDLVESVNQALGEFSDKLERAQLYPVFRHTEDSVPIVADGKLVWRVLSNLLSNIVKYAMPRTRIYLDLTRMNGKVILSLKNISKEALNIDAEELMERFVRGDVSRNTDGSGLGLNIAKSLMELQNGQLQMIVDGDLFKVTLIFPDGR